MSASTDIAKLNIVIDSTQARNAKRDLENLDKAGGGAEKSVDKLSTSASQLGKIFATLGIAKVLYDLIKVTKELIIQATLLNARFETMGVVMNVVGANAGYTSAQMSLFEKSLNKSGIAMIHSREVLTRMSQAHIKLADAQALSRIAQDAAVIGNINSSEALKRMIYGIQTAQIEVLRNIGINVNFEQTYKALAKAIGTTSDKLTTNQKLQARVNTVMETGPIMKGIYEAAMLTASKQLASMTRYTDDFKVRSGEVFNDTFVLLIWSMTDAFKAANKQLAAMKANGDLQQWSENLAFSLMTVTDGLSKLWKFVKLIESAGEVIATTGTNWYTQLIAGFIEIPTKSLLEIKELLHTMFPDSNPSSEFLETLIADLDKAGMLTESFSKSARENFAKIYADDKVLGDKFFAIYEKHITKKKEVAAQTKITDAAIAESNREALMVPDHSEWEAKLAEYTKIEEMQQKFLDRTLNAQIEAQEKAIAVYNENPLKNPVIVAAMYDRLSELYKQANADEVRLAKAKNDEIAKIQAEFEADFLKTVQTQYEYEINQLELWKIKYQEAKIDQALIDYAYVVKRKKIEDDEYKRKTKATEQALEDYLDEVDEKEKLVKKALTKEQKMKKAALEKEKKLRENAYKDFSDTIQSNTADILRDWDNAWETMTDIMKDALIEMAAEAISTNIVVPIALDIGSAMGLSWNGVPMSTMGAPDDKSLISTGGSLLSSGKSLWGAYSGATFDATYAGLGSIGIGAGMGSGVGTGVLSGVAGGGMSAVGGAGTLTTMASGLATVAPYIAAGIAAVSIIGDALSLFDEDLDPDLTLKSGVSTQHPSSLKYKYQVDPDDIADDEAISNATIKYFDEYFNALDDAMGVNLQDVLSKSDFKTVANLDKYGDDISGMFTAMSDDIFRDIRENLVGAMGLSSKMFNLDFFEDISADGQDLFSAFVGFENVAESFVDFGKRFNAQLDSGESMESAYTNLETISGIMSLAETSISSMGSTTTITALKGLISTQKKYIDTMKDTGATTEEINKIQKATIQELGASVSGLTANSLSTALWTSLTDNQDASDFVQTLENQVRNGVAQATVSAFSESLYSAFLTPLNSAIGSMMTNIVDSGMLTGAALTASMSTIKESLDAAISLMNNEEFIDLIAAFQSSVSQIMGTTTMTASVSTYSPTTYTQSITDITDKLKEFLDGLNSIIEQYTKSDITQQYQALLDWKSTQKATASELSYTGAEGLIDSAYAAQISGLVNSVFSDFVTPVIEGFATTMFTPFESALADIDMGSQKAISSLDELAGLLAKDVAFQGNITSLTDYKNKLTNVIEAIANVQKLQLTRDSMASLASAQAGVMGLGSEYELMRLSSTYGIDLGSFASQKKTVEDLSTASFNDFLKLSTDLNIPMETLISDMQSLAGIVQETEGTFGGLAETLSDYRSELSLSANSMMSSELKTTLARANFLDTYAASMSKDPLIAQKAMAELPGAATTMLELSKNTSKNMYEYDKDMSLVQRSLANAEEYALGYTATDEGLLTESQKQNKELLHLAGMVAGVSLIDQSIKATWENEDVQAFFTNFDAAFGSGVFTALDTSLTGLQTTLVGFSGVVESSDDISKTLPSLNSTLTDFLGIKDALPELNTVLGGFSGIVDTQIDIGLEMPILSSAITGLSEAISTKNWFGNGVTIPTKNPVDLGGLTTGAGKVGTMIPSKSVSSIKNEYGLTNLPKNEISGYLDSISTSTDSEIKDLINTLGFSASVSDIKTDVKFLQSQGYADGGISTGPTSGHMELLHGTEAVIPLKNGSVPVEMRSSDNKEIVKELKALRFENKMLLKENNVYLKKLHTIMRTKQSEDGTAFVTETA